LCTFEAKTNRKNKGGCLIVGEKSVVYQSASMMKGVHMKPTVIRAYGKIDADGSRFLLGDDQGNLFVVVLQVEGGKLLDLKLEALGQVSVVRAPGNDKLTRSIVI